MNIIICGAGRVGQGIARRLSQDKHDVTVVDSDPRLVNQVTSEYDVKGVTGHAGYPEVLQQAGASEADMVIAVTYSDEVNMITCQVAHTIFQTPTRIARVRSQSYLESRYQDLFSRSGLPVDVVISPEIEVGHSILQRLETPGAFYSADFAEGKLRLLGLTVSEGAPIAHTALDQIDEIFPDLTFRIVGIGRNERLFAPRSNDQLAPGDRAYLTIATDQIDRLQDLFAQEVNPSRRIVIVGAGNIGLYLAEKLEADRSMRVRLLELDLKRAEYVANRLRRAIVIQGDGLNPEALEESGVSDADVVVGLTNDDKTNLLLSATAKRLGAKKTVALVNDENLKNVHRQLDVDVVVDPRAITISRILLRLRRGRIVNLHSLESGLAEVSEGIVLESSGLVDQPLDYETLPDGMSAGAVFRKGEVLPISPKLKVKAGDHVVMFSERAMSGKVEKLFRVSPNFF